MTETVKPVWPWPIRLMPVNVTFGPRRPVWSWLAQVGEGAGMCETGSTPAHALRALADRIEKWSCDYAQDALLAELGKLGRPLKDGD